MPGMAILARMTRLSTRIVVCSLVALVAPSHLRTFAPSHLRTSHVCPASRRLAAQQCVDYSDDPAGCQPSTFDTPIAPMPTGRVDRRGQLDASSSEARRARRFGSSATAPVPQFRAPALGGTCRPSATPATGAWRGGDLAGAGDSRGLGIAGNCIFVGHGNGAGLGARSISSRSSRIRRRSRQSKSASSLRSSSATKDSTIASSARSSTRLERRRSDAAREERRHEHDRPARNVRDRRGYVSRSAQERGARLPCAVARVLSLARSG